MREMNILDFEEMLKGIDPVISIKIKSRDHEPKGSDSKFYVQFSSCSVIMGHNYIGTFGNGKSPKKAIKDYCKRISGQKLIFNGIASDIESFTITAPPLYYKK